ncbi:hypothetical protein [Thalassoroseus pseudoceratinae]|uniref:hypothetical protein n=1 Tax=Thalassoroseus pseudoceratinae TaxID=2713176 RepID=UPI0014206DAB|nr:hypothetical protein [Thalassoroseus pseudoceratinae]
MRTHDHLLFHCAAFFDQKADRLTSVYVCIHVLSGHVICISKKSPKISKNGSSEQREKPVSILLDFEKAVEGLLGVKPEDAQSPKSDDQEKKPDQSS